MISVIVPVYNGEKYIKECIESIVNQKKINIELIIINDGSTDNSHSIIKEYKKKYSNITYIKQNNHGVVYTRKEAIKYATGEYIMFVDADDYIKEGMLQQMYEFAKKNNIDYVRCNYCIKRNKKITKHNFAFENEKIYQIKEFSPTIYKEIINTHNLTSIWATIIKKDIIKKVLENQSENYIFAEDYLANLMIIDNIKNIGFIDYDYYVYRQNPTSITKTFDCEKRKKIIENSIDVYESIFKYIEKWNIKEEFYLAALKRNVVELENRMKELTIFTNYKNFKENIYIFNENIRVIEYKKINDKQGLYMRMLIKKKYLMYYMLNNIIYFSKKMIIKILF